jgi:hypothetical protein
MPPYVDAGKMQENNAAIFCPPAAGKQTLDKPAVARLTLPDF